MTPCSLVLEQFELFVLQSQHSHKLATCSRPPQRPSVAEMYYRYKVQRAEQRGQGVRSHLSRFPRVIHGKLGSRLLVG